MTKTEWGPCFKAVRCTPIWKKKSFSNFHYFFPQRAIVSLLQMRECKIWLRSFSETQHKREEGDSIGTCGVRQQALGTDPCSYRSGQCRLLQDRRRHAGQTALLYSFQNTSEEVSFDSETAECHQVNPDDTTCAVLSSETTNHLTNFMELSPSWEAANCAATEELPNILWNSKDHNHVNKSRTIWAGYVARKGGKTNLNTNSLGKPEESTRKTYTYMGG
jgi:hypothetical protein